MIAHTYQLGNVLLLQLLILSPFLSTTRSLLIEPQSYIHHLKFPTCEHTLLALTTETNSSPDDDSTTTSSKSEGGKKKDNKAMAFLRKIGKVGRSTNQDFINAMGVDEGPAGKSTGETHSTVRKSKSAYKECTVNGIIDDLTDEFPFTSSGTQWSGFTDRVMGGVSSGSLSREEVKGKTANVLQGTVSLENNGGFVQMATNLALDPAVTSVVDASDYDGIELEVLYKGNSGEKQSFNVHFKNNDCLRQFSSYRATFTIDEGEWCKVRLPWTNFVGNGPGADTTPFDVTALRRVGILAIGKEMDVFLAVAGVRFYNVI